MTCGRRLAVSVPRRLVGDLMHFARRMPLVTVERRMPLGPLVAARLACPQRPSWTALFVKAFALVAATRPELRRSYQPLPWPHFYEHPESVAAVTVERDHDGEEIPVIARLSQPDQSSLAELDAKIRRHKTAPAAELPTFRRMLRLGAWPRPLRRLGWRLALDLNGRWRVRHTGTFAVSSVSACGAGAFHLLSVTPVTVHYGLFDAAGNLDVRLTFDHRVFDGGPAARALVDLEQTLLGAVVAELQPAARAAA